MSMERMAVVTCPECGVDGEFKVWDTINTSMTPDMKAKVRNGEAFEFVCKNCGNTVCVEYPILYHQMEDKVMINLVLDNLDEAAEEMKKVSEMLDDYQVRIVSTIPRFREKLLILDAGLDDRVVEMIKLITYNMLVQLNPGSSFEEIFFSIGGDGNPEFMVSIGDAEWTAVPFPMISYNDLANREREKLQKNEDMIIDQEWAENYLNECEVD